jgi:hypothetical protein
MGKKHIEFARHSRDLVYGKLKAGARCNAGLSKLTMDDPKACYFGELGTHESSILEIRLPEPICSGMSDLQARRADSK